MKRRCLWLWTLVLLTLWGCGDKAASAPEVSQSSGPALIDEGGYVTPESWVEEEADNTPWGYLVTESVSTPWDALPEGWRLDGGSYYTLEDRTLTHYGLDGTVLCSLTLDSLLPEDADQETSESFTVRFDQEDVWLLRDVFTVLDPDTGRTQRESYLERWSQTGKRLLRLALDEELGQGSSEELTTLVLSPQGTPLLLGMNDLWSLDKAGAVATHFDTAGVIYTPCLDRDGRVYLKDESTGSLYTIDWDMAAPGQALFQPGPLEAVRPGSGPYDFFLVSDALLKGVVLETGTITTLLRWEDMDLGGAVQDVTWLDEDTYLTQGYSFASGAVRYLDVTRVPRDQVPVKIPVRLAVPQTQGAKERNMDVLSILPAPIIDAITDFNLTNGTYQIQAVPYGSAQELQLMLSSEPPDLIYWDYLEEQPYLPSYARRGLLTDLEPLIQADPELELSDFYPSVVSAARARGGGLYAMPLQFYLRSLSAPAEYVGTDMGWTWSRALEVAENLPEGMTLFGDMDQEELLSNLLDIYITQFSDQAAGTCDFENQDFYDLLTLCREGTAAGMEPLLNTEVQLGTLSHFAGETLSALAEQDRTLIGYPGAGGNGMNMVLSVEFSICALGQQQEAAWDFYRTLLTPEFQYALGSLQLSVRQDTQQDWEQWFLEYGQGCTEEQSLAVRGLPLEVESYTDYDSPLSDIVLEEAAAFFAGDRSIEDTAAIIQNRAEIYLGEQG